MPDAPSDVPDSADDAISSEYSDIVAVVEVKLLRKITEPTEFDSVEMEIAFLLPDVLVRVPCLGADYDAIVGQEKRLFDGAVGRLVAARFRAGQLAAENDGKGQVIESDIGDVRKRYSSYNAGRDRKPSVEEQWVAEAEQALGAILNLRRLARLKAGLSAPGSFVGMPGRRRAEAVRNGGNDRSIDLRDLLLPRAGFYADRFDREL